MMIILTSTDDEVLDTSKSLRAAKLKAKTLYTVYGIIKMKNNTGELVGLYSASGFIPNSIIEQVKEVY